MEEVKITIKEIKHLRGSDGYYLDVDHNTSEIYVAKVILNMSIDDYVSNMRKLGGTFDKDETVFDKYKDVVKAKEWMEGAIIMNKVRGE